MNDKELLELAAKAAGYTFTHAWSDKFAVGTANDELEIWNPIENDSDALRLAVKLKIDIEFLHENAHEGDVVTATKNSNVNSICCFENTAMNSNLFKAARRAIVRAAAEIGRNMP